MLVEQMDKCIEGGEKKEGCGGMDSFEVLALNSWTRSIVASTSYNAAVFQYVC